MIRGRNPTKRDLRRMQKVVALVTAYDLGTREGDFSVYREILREEKRGSRTLQSAIAFAWLLVRTMEENGMDREEVLDWYGKRFAVAAELE